MLHRLFREPVVHFLLLGLALFGLNAWLSPRTTSASKKIVVTSAFKDELARGFSEANGRPPTPAELDEAVARWIDDEVLYREGLDRGLDRDDARVRQRVASKMGFVIESKVTVPEPTEAELQQWFSEHAERWQKAELVDFVQVFVEGSDENARARANELLERLEAGTDPSGLGDRFSGGRHYRGRRIDDLGKSFGDEFVVGLNEQPIGKWSLRRSKHGFHLVRVERRTEARGAEFEAARADVAKDWKDERRAREVARARDELKRKFRIERVP